MSVIGVVDRLSQIDVWAQNVHLTAGQRREIEARRTALNAKQLEIGRAVLDAHKWLCRDLERARAAEREAEEEFTRKLNEWTVRQANAPPALIEALGGPSKSDPKPHRTHKPENDVKTLERAVELLAKGYPDTYDPGDVRVI